MLNGRATSLIVCSAANREQALLYFEESLAINRRVLPRDHPTIATVLGLAGLTHPCLVELAWRLLCKRRQTGFCVDPKRTVPARIVSCDCALTARP